MTLEKLFPNGDVLDSNDPSTRFMLDHAIYEQ